MKATLSVTALLLAAGLAPAAVVSPMIGGGQLGMMAAPMKHADISFVSGHIHVHIDDTVATPTLRPLASTDTFANDAVWSVLQSKAYNYQYAWNPDVSGGWINLATEAIYVKRLHHDAGLKVYLRPPAFVSGETWPAVFQTDGEVWKWNQSMQHNAYAVLNPTQTVYTAEYEVYVGNITTGAPVESYGSEIVTWTWNAVPEPTSASLLAAGAIGLRRRRRA